MRERRTAAAGVGLLVLALMTGSSVAAEPPPVVYRSPASDEVVKTATVTVSADVYLGTTTGLSPKVQLELAGEKERATQERESEPGNQCQRFTFAVPVRHNGQYRATITALAADPTPPTGSCEGAGTGSRVFFVAASPGRPAGVEATTANGQVKVSDRNPEPDLVNYRIQRSKGSSGPFEPAGETPPRRSRTCLSAKGASSVTRWWLCAEGPDLARRWLQSRRPRLRPRRRL